MCKLHCAHIRTAWLCSPYAKLAGKVHMPNWPVCSTEMSHIWSVLKQKIRQRRAQTVEQMKSYIIQEWGNILKIQQLIYLVPQC